jgi:hypothetical protein
MDKFLIIERDSNEFYSYMVDQKSLSHLLKTHQLENKNRVNVTELDNECDLSMTLTPGQWIRVEMA